MKHSKKESGPVDYNAPAVVQERTKLQKEVNEHKVNIDYACFAKTPEEVKELKLAKKSYLKLSH